MGEEGYDFTAYTIGRNLTVFAEHCIDSKSQKHCRACLQPIKTKTYYEIYDTGNYGQKRDENRCYCHKCIKALRKAHKTEKGRVW